MAKLKRIHSNRLVIVVPILLVVLFAGLLTYSFANFKSIKGLDIIGSYFLGNSYTLSYNDPNCTSKTIKNGKPYGELCAPNIHEGYTLNGWKNGNNYILSSDIVRTSSNISVTADITANQYNVNFDNNNNLMYGLNNVGLTTASSNAMQYSINNGVVTVTALQNDGWGKTPGRVDLTQNKTYIVSFESDGSLNWVNEEDSVQLFLLYNGSYSDTAYNPNNANVFEFTPANTGTYHLRLDSNEQGKTHTFWNISVKEKINPIEVTYDQPYGTLPTPSKTGYIFDGWNGKNLINITDLKTYSNWSDSLITASGYQTSSSNRGYLLNVKPNTTYTIKYTTTGTSAGEFPRYFYLCKATSSSSSLVSYLTTTEVYRTEYTFTTAPGETYYLRVSDSNTEANFNNYVGQITSIQLEENDHVTAMEPYIISSSTTVTQAKDHTLYAQWRKPKILYVGLWQYPGGTNTSSTTITIGSLSYTSISDEKVPNGANWWYGRNYDDLNVEVLGGTTVYFNSNYGANTRWYTANSEDAYLCTGARLIGEMPYADTSIFVYPDILGMNDSKRRVTGGIINLRCG